MSKYSRDLNCILHVTSHATLACKSDCWRHFRGKLCLCLYMLNSHDWYNRHTMNSRSRYAHLGPRFIVQRTWRLGGENVLKSLSVSLRLVTVWMLHRFYVLDLLTWRVEQDGHISKFYCTRIFMVAQVSSSFYYFLSGKHGN